MSTDNEMLEGYLDGFQATETEFPERLKNRGAQYQHGWLNGRDDRTKRPRAAAAALRADAALAIEKDAMP